MASARRDMTAVDTQSRARVRLARRLYVVALVLALLISTGAIIIAAFRAEASAQDVANRIAPVVAAEQIRNARTERTVNARALLTAANDELRRRNLPIVADPGPGANADQLQVAASTAQVLSVLPEPVAEQLRAEGRDVILLPQPDGTLAGPGTNGTAPGVPQSQNGAGGDGTGGGRDGRDGGDGQDGAPTTTGRVEPSAARVPTVRPAPRPGPSAPAPGRPGPGPNPGPPRPGPGPQPQPQPPAPAPEPERGGIRLDLPLLPPVELPRIRLGVDVRV